MIQIERYLTLIIKLEMRAFSKVEILMFFHSECQKSLSNEGRIIKRNFLINFFASSYKHTHHFNHGTVKMFDRVAKNGKAKI